MEYPQIYKLSPEEARARGETALFRESKRMNVACKEAIETAIRVLLNIKEVANAIGMIQRARVNLIVVATFSASSP